MKILVVFQNVAPNSSVISRLATLLESCGLQTKAISICSTFQDSFKARLRHNSLL